LDKLLNLQSLDVHFQEVKKHGDDLTGVDFVLFFLFLDRASELVGETYRTTCVTMMYTEPAL
jgi:hypothetical protein